MASPLLPAEPYKNKTQSSALSGFFFQNPGVIEATLFLWGIPGPCSRHAVVTPQASELQAWLDSACTRSPLWLSLFHPKLIFNDTLCYVGPQGALSGCALIKRVSLLAPFWEDFIKTGDKKKKKVFEVPDLSPSKLYISLSICLSGVLWVYFHFYINGHSKQIRYIEGQMMSAPKGHFITVVEGVWVLCGSAEGGRKAARYIDIIILYQSSFVVIKWYHFIRSSSYTSLYIHQTSYICGLLFMLATQSVRGAFSRTVYMC